jgi:hypothetical protein
MFSPEMTPDLREKFKMVFEHVYRDIKNLYQVGIVGVRYLKGEEVFLISIAGLSQKSPIRYQTHALEVHNGEVINVEGMQKLVREYEKARIRLPERPHIELPLDEMIIIEEMIKIGEPSIRDELPSDNRGDSSSFRYYH